MLASPELLVGTEPNLFLAPLVLEFSVCLLLTSASSFVFLYSFQKTNAKTPPSVHIVLWQEHLPLCLPPALCTPCSPMSHPTPPCPSPPRRSRR